MRVVNEDVMRVMRVRLALIIHKLANVQRSTPRSRKLQLSYPKHCTLKPEAQAGEVSVIYLACAPVLNNPR